MLEAQNVSLQYGKRVLFDEVNIKFHGDNCYGVIGANGAGKSTFLKILTGEISPNTGSVSLEPGKRMAVLKQNHFEFDEVTALNTVMMGHKTLWEIIQEKDAIYAKPDFSDADGMRASELEAEFAEMDGWNAESDAASLLSGLGIEEADHYRPLKDLSGNQKVRVLLAQALFGNPDVLILDEPTNHIDIESVLWLEDFLVNKANAVMVISHDRAFIDNITNRTIEVTMGRIYDYKASYSHYIELRKERRETQLKAFKEQKKFIAEQERFVERFKGTYSKTNQVSSVERMLEKLEIVQIDEVDSASLRLRFPPAPRSGDYPVIVEDLTKKYGDYTVFEQASMTIERGEKIAFVGRNGEGKSTMIKAIMQEIEVEGKCQIGHNIEIGYFAQNQASLLDPKLSVFETVDEVARGEIRTQIKHLLGGFMFSGEDIDKKVSVLSGGEKTRLAMVKLLLEPHNLLILDEPTNHLDLRSKDVLKDALLAFDGTLILVSHDRDFLKGIAEKVFEFKDKRVREHFETIDAFLERNKAESMRDMNL